MNFSVIIPLYNKRNSLRQCIQSVLNQTYGNFELIIVDDGSTDGSGEIVREFSDNRIRFIQKENAGVSSTRNLGIKSSHNQWITFLDADDVWAEWHLETMVRLAESEPLALVLSSSIESFTDSEGVENKLKTVNKDFNHYLIKDLYSDWLNRKQVICSSSAVVHISCFAKIGYFREDLIKGEDTNLWARLFEHFVFAKTDMITAFYRTESMDGNASRRVNSVKKYEVYYFKPQWFVWSSKTLYQFHVIYGYIKHFIYYKQPKNLILLLLKYNFGLIVVLFQRFVRIFQGRTKANSRV
ncbi:MAG: glycosyltransferase family 2 protein [Bacteroidales bacterium]|jgi:glycosyltransferase involved in cell wall biosynthesis|nr:glycosyltransferase family 2 protein [Bacteroidales bacterium]